MLSGLVPLGSEVTREFELDLSLVRPKGTELIPIFRDYGLPRPPGAPRPLRRDLPDRYIFFEPCSLVAMHPAKDLASPEAAVNKMYEELEKILSGLGRVYYAGARLTWREWKLVRPTVKNVVRLSVDRLRRRSPDYQKLQGELMVQIQLDVIVGKPLN